jgi:hypothetical protein
MMDWIINVNYVVRIVEINSFHISEKGVGEERERD